MFTVKGDAYSDDAYDLDNCKIVYETAIGVQVPDSLGSVEVSGIGAELPYCEAVSRIVSGVH